jgi:hypothetical protein
VAESTSKSEDETPFESNVWATGVESVTESSLSAPSLPNQTAAWQTVVETTKEDGAANRRESNWSMGNVVDVVDMYCDDELNGDDPNLQLQIVQNQGTGSATASPAGTGKPRAMLLDQGEQHLLFYRCYKKLEPQYKYV